jgi:hypothetical protein
MMASRDQRKVTAVAYAQIDGNELAVRICEASYPADVAIRYIAECINSAQRPS